MPFAVLRIQKLKTWGAIAGSGKHNQRERDTPNADASRTAQNTMLIGSPDKSSVDAVKKAIGNQRIRSNAVLGVEMLLSASPDYFRPDAPEKAGTYEPERLQAWTQTATQWLQERYGSRVISATLHLDEVTPHIHALLVPLDDKGKLNCRALFGGSKHLVALTNGLRPGRCRNRHRARHPEFSRYASEGQPVLRPGPGQERARTAAGSTI